MHFFLKRKEKKEKNNLQTKIKFTIMGVLKPIHAATGQEMGYTLDRLPVCEDEIEKHSHQ